jgi:hypothetical protein
MRLIHCFASASILAASALYAQTPPPSSPPASPPGSSPGTRPAPTSPTTGGPSTTPVFPTTGGTSPSKTTVVFPTDLFRMNDVSKSISLTDRQVNQLNTMTQQLQSRFQVQFEKLASLPAQQRADRMLELNREYTNAWINGAREFLNGTQLTRYQQLQFQFGGFASLTDPILQKALNISDAQMTKLRADVTWSDQQLAAIREAALTNEARALQMFNTFNATAQERWNQLLSADQQRAWAQLTGDPFAFPPPFPAAAPIGGPPPKR